MPPTGPAGQAQPAKTSRGYAVGWRGCAADGGGMVGECGNKWGLRHLRSPYLVRVPSYESIKKILPHTTTDPPRGEGRGDRNLRISHLSPDSAPDPPPTHREPPPTTGNPQATGAGANRAEYPAVHRAVIGNGLGVRGLTPRPTGGGGEHRAVNMAPWRGLRGGLVRCH